MDPNRIIDLMVVRIAAVLGRPAAEAMRDAAMLQAQLEHAAGQQQDQEDEQDG